MESAKPPKPPKSERRKVSRKRRLLMLAVGVGLGVACRLIPHEYQGPCAMVVKVLGLVVGVSP